MQDQVIINNLLISFSRFGDNGAAAAVIFLHGWRSNKEVWNGVVQRVGKLGNKRDGELESKRVGIYCLDLPGFGGSPAPKQEMTVGDYAEAVAGFIRKLNLKNVAVVGHSFGGRVGIRVASAHPELVHKLVLVDSAGFPSGTTKKNIMAVAAKIVKPFFKPQFMQPLRRKVYQKIGAEDYIATPELQKTFVNIVKENLTADMENLRLPTLLIWGRNDQDTPISFARKMYALIPKAQLLILEHAGHFSFLDKPEIFVSALWSFIKP